MNAENSVLDRFEIVTPAVAKESFFTREFISIPAREIHVDYDYQRLVRSRRVSRLVAQFDPKLLGTLEVSERADGSYWVIDGQHRLEACKAIDPDLEVPCVVYRGLTREEEAEVFWKTQDGRSNVSPAERLVARLAQGEPKAVAIVDIMTANNVRAVSWVGGADASGGLKRTTRAIAAIEVAFARLGASGLDRVLHILSETWADKHADTFRADHIHGLSVLIDRFPELSDDRLIDKINEITPMDLKMATRSYITTIDSGRGGTATARALVALYNYKLRKEAKLEWTG